MQTQSRTSLFSICLFVAVAACAKAKTPAAPADHTSQVVPTVAGQTFQTGMTTLGISQDTSFDLLMDTAIRDFTGTQTNSSSVQESDARCLLKITGTLRFLDPSIGNIVNNGHVEYAGVFTIKDVFVVSSGVARPDLTSIPADQSCVNYAKELKSRQVFNQAISRIDAKHITFNEFNFDIPNGKANGSNSQPNYLFNSRLFPIANTYSVVRNGTEFIYMVKTDSLVDITRAALKDLDGDYATTTGQILAISISAKQHQILLTSKTCGLIYQINVQQIFADSQSVKAKLLPTQVTGFSAGSGDPSASNECAILKGKIENLSAAPVAITYLTQPASSGRSYLNITLSNAQTDADVWAFTKQ